MDSSILVGRGYSECALDKNSKPGCTSNSEDCYISANHADPDEMLHSAASQLGLYGLPTYSLGVTVPRIQGIKKISKQFVLKVASDLLSSSYSLYCLQSEHREQFYF